jgi:hypothetical protein
MSGLSDCNFGKSVLGYLEDNAQEYSIVARAKNGRQAETDFKMPLKTTDF